MFESKKQAATVIEHWNQVINNGASFSSIDEPPKRDLFTNTIDIDTALKKKNNYQRKSKSKLYCFHFISDISLSKYKVDNKKNYYGCLSDQGQD